MKTASMFAALGLLLLAAGCIPSVYPWYTPGDLVFEPRLIGEWQQGDGEIWQFEPTGDKDYNLTVTEESGKRGKFTATLFRVKGNFFLDLTPVEFRSDDDQADLVTLSIIAGHMLFRVLRIDSTLSIAYTNYDWLSDYLPAHPKALAFLHEPQNPDDQNEPRVITASTRALQAFVAKHLDDLFRSPTTFERNAPQVAADQ